MRLELEEKLVIEATWLQRQKKSRQTTRNDGRQRQSRERTCFSFLNSLVIRQRNPMPSVKKRRRKEKLKYFFFILLWGEHNSWVRICIAKPTAITRRVSLLIYLNLFLYSGNGGKKRTTIFSTIKILFFFFNILEQFQNLVATFF